MHFRKFRFYGKAIAAACFLLFASISFSAPAPQNGQVGLGWSYDFAGNPSVTGFNVYYGTNATAIANWDGNTNACRCYQFFTATGSTNTSATITGLVRGATYYFTVTPTSSTAEGDYCNEVRTAIPTKPGKANGLIVITVQ
jgi:hypothetical protein